MKKALATAGKTAIEFLASNATLFAAVILTAAGVRVACLGPGSLDNTVAAVAPLLVLLLWCVCYTQEQRIQRLLTALDHTIEERDSAEQDLMLERVNAKSPMSWDELAQLKDGAGEDPIRVQLAWMRHRKEQQAEAQQTAETSE